MKKVVILITGQKKRLELLSKIKYLIKPLKVEYNVIVVLSLSKTQNFTNRKKYKKIISSSCNIKKELKNIKYYINNIEYPKLKINKKIVSMYDKRGMGKKFRDVRATNHVKQYYTLAESWPMIKKIKPRILIRIRDDAILSERIKLSEFTLLNSNSKKCVITPRKNSWGGINDKFAIVSKKAIRTYLKKPYKVYKSYNNEYKQRLSNPEIFYKNVYINNDLLLFVSNIKINIKGQ